MRLQNMPRADDSDIEDLRETLPGMSQKPKPPSVADGKSDIVVDDKSLINEPSGDIGEEMQPVMRGYGKVEKSLKKWRVR